MWWFRGGPGEWWADLQDIVERGFLGAEFAVLDTDPDEAGDLRDEPDQKAHPRAVHLRPALLIHEAAVGYDHGDRNDCYHESITMNG